MKQLLVLFSVLLCSTSMFAQHRSEQEAMQIAQEFFGKQGKSPQLSVVPHQKVEAQVRKRVSSARKAPAKSQSFYVVNDEANNRFIIVSADERMYQILGYSDNGTFDAENIPVALFEIFDGYDRQYDLLLEHAESIEMINSQRAAIPAIEPLVKTKWGQDTPFNDDCPLNKRASDGSKCASGCVATAMAQVMNYHQYPTTGIGTYSYVSATQKHYQSMDFSQLNFNWENMQDTYGDNSSEAQKAEVAKLMHACGISVSMDYGNSSDGQSGASPYDIAYAMINYFGYNPNTVFKMKDYYSLEEWNSIILQELEAGRPMLYGGRGTGGHRFILDGCDDNGLYHFNFGWTVPGYSVLDGYGNGYYSLDAIRPRDVILNFLAGEEVDLGNYSNEQSLVCQISPNTIGSHEDIFYASSFNISTSSAVKVGDSVNCWFRATNYSSSTSSTDNKSEKFKGEVGIGLYDTNWNFIKSLYSENFSKHSSESARVDHDVTLDASSFNSGKQYFIAPYAKATISETPTRIRANYGKGWYLAEVDGGNIVLTKNGEPEHIEYPPIPTGTIYASASGAGDKQVSDTNEKPTTWQLTLTKDPNEPAMYWFDNFEPSVSGNSNRVYGFIDKAGSQISIPIGQKVGENLSITTFSNSGDIIVNVSSVDSTMIITDAWGTIETSNSGDNTTSKQLSLYSTTNFSFKPFTPEPDSVVISKPLITVDDSKMMSITCSTSPVDIYYTLNGTEPSSQASAKYTSSVQLTGNCTIKAIACKDGKTSEIAIYEETEFVVSKPTFTQSTEGDIEIFCSPIGATIYYTEDGTNPTEESTKYEGKFTPNESCVIKAIGLMQNYTNSEIATFVYSKPGGELVINNNVAGNLSARIPENEKTSTKGLIVSGDLNGTDIAFIREMIINGKLTDLNIENSNIVSGGDPYYVPEYGTPDYTTDNVIGKNMFDDCSNLITLKLPSSVTTISRLSFWGCTNLKELRFPASCTTVESSSFYGCKNLLSIYLGSQVDTFEGDNFSGCDNLGYIDVDAENKKFKSVEGVLYTTSGKLVKYPIGRNDKEFSIPNEITEIGKNAFDDASIESVAIPEGLVGIGSSAFAGCKNLKAIVIPNSVSVIGRMAFWGCSSLSNVKMPENLSKIESSVFSYCISLRDFTVEKNVKEIADNAFDDCTSLQRYFVNPENISYRSENGILYTKDLKILKRCPQALFSDILLLPDEVETIAPNAFDGCINIKQFRLPKTLISIGNSAFSDCKMTSIEIADAVTSIDNMAFWGCDELQTFAFPEGIKKISSSILDGCDKLEYIYIPSSVEKIESSAFYGCKSLTTIDSRIKDIDKLEVYYLASLDEYTPFTNVSDTCTWIVPSGPVSDIDKYARKYMEQPWWVPTWRIKVSQHEEPLSIALASDVVTFCSVEDLDFNNVVSGSNTLKAYIASGFNPTTNTVVLLHVNEVPARTGLVLVGKAGTTYEVPYRGTDYVYSNLLKGVLSDTEITSGFILNNGEFIAANGTSTVKAGEAYLDIDGVSTSRLNLRFVEPEELGVDDVTGITNHQNSWHTLQGVRLDGQPTQPGIYLHGGRKVMVK
ncbi:MAG: leucine-rich repeat protein [Bacteroidaceae bacterium]|nr:leucine-rich repeat protein [Bacteroidaceae bacterium]